MSVSESSGARALITGASSGLGAVFARRLAQDHADLILVARRQDRLEALAQELRAAHGVNVEVLAADLADSDGLRKVEARAAADPAVTMLINNAGFGGYRPFVTLEPDEAEALIRVQVLAVTRLTRAVLPGLIARGQGAIINVSSRLAFSGPMTSPPLPKRATYAGTKAFINTFTQILADELAGTGVRVQALCPGVVKTEFHQRVGVDPDQFPAAIVMPAEAVVEASLAGLQHGDVICVPALDDPALLEQLAASQRQLFERSRSGRLADRYRDAP